MTWLVVIVIVIDVTLLVTVRSRLGAVFYMLLFSLALLVGSTVAELW